MAKTEVEIRFTLPLDEVLLKHKVDAEHKAREAFVLELLRQGDISAGRAARLLNISRWDLLELMYEAGISPLDDSLTAESIRCRSHTAELSNINRLALREYTMNLEAALAQFQSIQAELDDNE